MTRVRLSAIGLLTVFGLLLLLLLSLRQALLDAHADETIHYFASDAGAYFRQYETLYSLMELSEAPVLFLVASPILFMKLADGNLLLIQGCHLLLMAASLKVAFDCFATLRGRMAFMAGALLFPYFLFGFLSLNKEIYAMSAAIFYASYFIRGKRSHLLVALVLALCARYYMLLALLALMLLVPRDRRPRYGAIVGLLAGISLIAPLAKPLVPEYSSEDLLEAPSATASFFANAIDSYGYALIYPLKYIALIPMRAYSFLLDSSRAGNAMESAVSLASFAILALALSIIVLRRTTSDLIKRLIVLGLVAPVPIMWSEIMHWRYYSFVYFFFLFAVVLHFVERRRPLRAGYLVGQHA